ncbi:MAG: hypothetical protein AMXMBFR53_38660 [Gemmatimonadota bacterium]
MRETRARSLAKSLSWRVAATLTTIGLVWWATGQVHLAVVVGGVEFVAKLLIFYVHERLWDAVPWGWVERSCGTTPVRR